MSLPVPTVSQIHFSSFVVTAPSNVPYGVKLQLQFMQDEEALWADVGEPVGANATVSVPNLAPLTGYWVRWTQVR